MSLLFDWLLTYINKEEEQEKEKKLETNTVCSDKRT